MTGVSQVDKKKMDVRDRWFVVSNTINLLSILARGFIGPRPFISEHCSDFTRDSDAGILLFRGGMPAAFLSDEGFPRVMSRPVVFEIEIGSAGSLPVRVLDKGLALVTTPLRSARSADVAMFQGVLPLSSITNVWFASQSDLEDFRARAFDNVPLDQCCFDINASLFGEGIDSDLFGGELGSSVEQLVALVEADSNTIDPRKLKTISDASDRYVGGLVMLSRLAPQKVAWLRQIENSLIAKTKRGAKELDLMRFVVAMVGADDTGVVSAVEENVLRSVVELMADDRYGSGWSGKEFINTLVESVDLDNQNELDAQLLHRWSSVSQEVLSNRRDMVALDDSKSWVLRAILLLMLRREPSAVIEAIHSSLAPGERVVAAAGVLSGIHSGFERLSNSIKCDGELYRLVSQWVTRVINREMGCKIPKAVFKDGKAELQLSDTNVMAIRAVLKIDGVILLERHIEADRAIRKAKHVAEELGWRLRFDHERQRLDYLFELPSGRKQRVFVERGTPTARGAEVVRFWSPCLDLSSVERRKFLTSREKDLLLERNAEYSLHCRFGIDRAEKAVVVVADQLAETMDRKEFEEHMTNVAYAADEYEREKGLDDF